MENKKEVKKIIRKKFSGIVVSDKADKTLLVSVDITKINKKYQKRYTSSRKYQVHDEENKFKIGDKVSFTECRPLSKEKKWRVTYSK